MPVNQSPSWFHVDFISSATHSSLTPAHMHFSFSLPKMLRSGHDSRLNYCVWSGPETYSKCKLTNVRHSKLHAVWPLRGFRGINWVCGHHFWLKSPNTATSEACRYPRTSSRERLRTFHVINSSSELQRVHSPLACSPSSSSPRVCANVSSEMTQTYFKRL